jgi:hypothetical protein
MSKASFFFLKLTSPTPPFSFSLASISRAARDSFGVSISFLRKHCLKILSIGLRIPGGRDREHKKQIEIDDIAESTN